jgi:S1-C subfamily serine protease
LTAEELSNIEIYNRSYPATVNITSTVMQQSWFFEVYPVEESGSGFLIDDNGHILTNNHVVSGNAPQIEVTIENKNRYRAEILARDEANDLALIKIQADRSLPFLKLGESDNLRVGQKVLAIGNPFGLEGTLTTGVISSIGRSIRDRDGVLEDMIQTDAAINPGNSGGPLLDSSGNVIGVNTAIYGPGGNIGIGFAMPISRAKPLLEYVRSKAPQPAPIGVESLFLSSRQAQALELPAQPGYLVVSVERGSAAAAAGVRGASREIIVGNYSIPWGGDYIIKVDGREVAHRRVLTQALSLKHGGDSVRLTVVRDGRETEVTVKLQNAPSRGLRL